MKKYFENLAKALFGIPFSGLDTSEQRVIKSIANHDLVAENINESFEETLTLGQRVADRVAAFGGSWPFICLFFLAIALWITLNTGVWMLDAPFDPYPYILLNLGLSTLAAFQAPIIMMSQNRQAAKDRLMQEAAYAVNLKLELEIMRLHDKFDQQNAVFASKQTDN